MFVKADLEALCYLVGSFKRRKYSNIIHVDKSFGAFVFRDGNTASKKIEHNGSKD